MIWSAAKPTQPGLYWWKVGEGDEEVVAVRKIDGQLYVSFCGVDGPDWGLLDESYDGQWAGPIPKPKEAL
jgi:hypothetical protein